MSPAVRNLSKWVRTVHIYLSLPGLMLFAFFAATGILLNHDIFGLGQPQTWSQRAEMPADTIRRGNRDTVIQALRSSFGISLPLTRYNSSPGEIEATFSAPGKRIQVVVDRETKAAEGTFESRGLAGQLADLHKGAESGAVWRAIMDITSVYLLVSALSGVLLMLSIPKRRQLGILMALGGALAVFVVYVVWVPR